MILKELYVISLKEKEIIRKYVFNTSGLNVILGVAKKDSNGVGKTAMVDAIRMLLENARGFSTQRRTGPKRYFISAKN
jgi:uncharacterized protein YydD (DUF2326 family)